MKSAQAWVAPAPDAECHEIGPTDFAAAGRGLARDVAGILPRNNSSVVCGTVWCHEGLVPVRGSQML